MLLIDALNRAKNNIELGIKHASYDRACKLRTLYLQITTGQNITPLLPQFELREDRALFEQRVKITVENLSPISSPVMKKFFGVSRVEPSEKKFEADDVNKQQYLQKYEGDFFNGDDFEAYMMNYLDRIGMYDPNAFYVVDFTPFTEETEPRPYPIVFHSPCVYDWVFDAFGMTDFLFCAIESKIKVRERRAEIVVKDYYIFIEGHTIEFIEDVKERNLPTFQNSQDWTINKKVYKIVVRNTGSDKVKSRHPAKRLGYIIDDIDPNIFISPLQPAIPVFLDLIHDKSEYDISKRCHVFPQKVMYDDSCPGEVHIEVNRKCVNGYIAGTANVCSVCNGDGFKPHRSGQEIIKIKKPKSKDEFLPIDQLITYIKTELEAVRLLGEDIILNAQRVEGAIFSAGAVKQNSMTGTNSEAKTATELVITTEEYNFVLDSWAKNRSNLYIHTLLCMGQIFDTAVNVVHKYNGQYIRETITQVLNTLKGMYDSLVSPILINDAEYRVAKLQYDNDVLGLSRFMTVKRFMPFAGRSSAEIASLRGSENVPKRLKVLNDNLGYIFTEIESTEGFDFYTLDYKDQKVFVDKILAELLQTVEEEAPKLELRKPVF